MNYSLEKINGRTLNPAIRMLDSAKRIQQLLLMCYILKIKICDVYISKQNSNHENKTILLMIPNKEEWHCLAVKRSSALLGKISSKDVW